MNAENGNQLIKQLMNDPGRFDGNKLLKEYFRGFPVETLLPLLSDKDVIVRRTASSIASELGKLAKPLTENVIPLLSDGEPDIRFHALEVLAVCSFEDDIAKYHYVVRHLEDPHEKLRGHVMFLISNADKSQLEAASQSFGFKEHSDQLHQRGLLQLFTNQPIVDEISSMIGSHEPLLRRYGAVAAWRYRNRFPKLFSSRTAQDDSDLKKFWQLRVKQP